MRQQFGKIFLALLVFVIFCLTPRFVQAAFDSLYPEKNLDTSYYSPELPWFSEKTTLEEDFIPAVMKFMMESVGVVAFLVILYAGIQMVTSGVNTDQRESAKKALYFWIMGIIFIFFAYLIVKGITSLKFDN